MYNREKWMEIGSMMVWLFPTHCCCLWINVKIHSRNVITSLACLLACFHLLHFTYVCNLMMIIMMMMSFCPVFSWYLKGNLNSLRRQTRQGEDKFSSSENFKMISKRRSLRWEHDMKKRDEYEWQGETHRLLLKISHKFF